MEKQRKPRYNPNKKQNQYGGDYDCENYEERSDKTEWCHDEGQVGWNDWIKWSQKDENGKLKCKGNRHNCLKLRQQWLASLSDEKRKKIF
jgi:hypothetical protein